MLSPIPACILEYYLGRDTFRERIAENGLAVFIMPMGEDLAHGGLIAGFEASDFLYHMMVLLASSGVKLSEVSAELCKRNR